MLVSFPFALQLPHQELYGFKVNENPIGIYHSNLGN